MYNNNRPANQGNLQNQTQVQQQQRPVHKPANNQQGGKRIYDIKIPPSNDKNTYNFLAIFPNNFRKNDSERQTKLNELEIEVQDKIYYDKKLKIMKQPEDEAETKEQKLAKLDETIQDEINMQFLKKLEEKKIKEEHVQQSDIDKFVNNRMISIIGKDRKEKQRYIAETYLNELKDHPQQQYGYMFMKKGRNKQTGAVEFSMKFLNGSFQFQNENQKYMFENSNISEDLTPKQIQEKYIKQVDKKFKGLNNKNYVEDDLLGKRGGVKTDLSRDLEELDRVTNKKYKRNQEEDEEEDDNDDFM